MTCILYRLPWILQFFSSAISGTAKLHSCLYLKHEVLINSLTGKDDSRAPLRWTQGFKNWNVHGIYLTCESMLMNVSYQFGLHFPVSYIMHLISSMIVVILITIPGTVLNYLQVDFFKNLFACAWKISWKYWHGMSLSTVSIVSSPCHCECSHCQT